MGIFHDLIRTYDANKEYAGVPVDKGEPLCPVSHYIYNAQIEIILNEDGKFVSAAAVDKADQRTIIPVTEESASRTSNTDAAHPLCEQLEYLFPSSTSKKNMAYIKALKSWRFSDDGHPFLDIVYNYVTGESILQDLASVNVITLDSDGTLTDGRINGTKYEKCLVRWRLKTDNGSTASWECPALFDAYQRYYDKHGIKNIGVCCLTGETVPLASVFDKGLILSCSGAKLVSSNDYQGFTYRGRTSEPWQTAQIGYVAAQKAHRALRWLANHNAVYVGSRAYIIWSPSHNVYLDPFTFSDTNDNTTSVIVSEYRNRLYKAINGYSQLFADRDDIILASFDAATTGRLSVTQYCKLSASSYLKNMQNWHESCCWSHYYFGIRPAKPSTLATYAYGTQQKSATGISYMEANELVVKKTVQHLYHCLLHNAPLPYELIGALMKQSRLLVTFAPMVREEMIALTCAVFRKYENDKAKREVWTMTLDKAKQDRSYQFGRLLAVYEKIERDTYDEKETREPQAIRMQAAYMDHPMRTAMYLKRSIDYYLSKQRIPGLRMWYRSLIDQIMSVIAEFNDADLDKPLTGSFLLGYSLQRIDLVAKKNKELEEE